MMLPVEPARRSPVSEGSRPHSLTHRARGAAILAGGTLLVALSACGDASKYPQTSLDPKSDLAIEIDNLWNLTLVLGVGVSLITFAILAYILYHFRWRPDSPQPKQVHGNTTLEIAWTLVPAVLISIVAVPTVRTIFYTYRDAPPDALTVEVEGWQWWWAFRYPMANGDTIVTANEFHVPVGRTVRLQMRSKDVIHSFWLPQMGGKRDVIPGRMNEIVFTPLEAGVYLGQCAEFCGESHALMKMRLIAHEPEDFERWLANESLPAVAVAEADSSIAIGQELYMTTGCAGCHTIQGVSQGRLAPDLTHVARRSTIAAGILDNNAQNLHAWIKDSPSLKPGSLMPNLGLTDQQVEYIVAYMQTLY